MFRIFELVVICAFLYLAVNLVRYFFFKESMGGKGMFGLSDKWITKDKQWESEKYGEKGTVERKISKIRGLK